MPDWWSAVVFGWPAMILSLVLAMAGTVLRKPMLVLMSVAPTLGFSFYLSGAANWMALAGPAIAIALIGTAYAVRRDSIRVAWGLIALFIATVVLVAVNVWDG